MKLNRLSLNVVGLNRIGLNRIGSPSRGSSSGSDRSYIDPEVLASLKAVCICYGKSNDDPDRAIVKNLVDPDNPFVISNAAFKLNSGFGLYAADFLDWTSSKDAQKTSFEVKITSSNYKENWVAYKAPNTTFKAMKVRISGIPDGGALQFFRTTADGGGIKMVNGINEIPAFTNTVAAGFYIDIPLGFDWSNLVIEQIPSFEGAFVADGIDDLITSTKSATEMLDGSNEITVVSMIHQIDGNVNYTNGYTNYIRHSGGFIRNSVTGINGKGFNKTGIYGYTSTQLDSSNTGLGNVINNILGDKDDYSFERSSTYTLDDAKYSVQNFVNANNQPSNEGSSVAWYWTIIANKVLTTDQINQVIAYFNLDRTLNPDILCNTIKQGITNENHAEFGDKLIDFSGNGRDIQLNNIAWKGDSGIGKYETDFTTWTRGYFTDEVNFTPSKIEVTGILTTNSILINNKPTPIYNVEIHSPNKSIVVYYQYNDDTGVKRIALVDGINELPSANDSLFVTSDRLNSKGITITQIPSHAGALCLDGVNDFGKVTGMPVYKDYTVVTDREIFANTGAISSKNNPGAFAETAGNSVYSFGQATSGLNFISTRSISYLSKYSYCGQSITAGAAEDGTDMWLGTIRDNDSRFFNGAIYSLMSFPYSMSEFLIERQLKKHKLGTLYPDMVEWRPIIKSNIPYSSITYSVNPGEYISVDSMVTITVTLPNTSDKLMEMSCNAISDISISGDNGVYEITGKVGKSPQKINLVISSYLTMLNNETLISNETLIKNE